MYILLLCGFSNFTKFLCILFYILFIKINSLHFYRLPTAQVDFPVTRHGVEGCLDGVHDKRHLRLLGLRDDSYYSTWRQKKIPAPAPRGLRRRLPRADSRGNALRRHERARHVPRWRWLGFGLSLRAVSRRQWARRSAPRFEVWR